MQLTEPPLRHRDCVVIGASAGGLETLSDLLARLDPGLPAAVLVVLHVSAQASGHHASLLDRAAPLKVRLASDGAFAEQGTVYVAPPDRHLLLEGAPDRQDAVGRVRLARGPKENRARPAIDPLFRSAAVTCGARTTGVILTGLLDDGVSGLDAIRACGGTTVVQDPRDAAFPDLPRNALAHLSPDYVVPVSRMAPLLAELARSPVGTWPPVPERIEIEARIAHQARSDMESAEQIGTRAPYSCPECNGPLWQIDDPAIERFRCHVGHGYTARTLAHAQDEALEQALWAALRTLEERARLLEGMTDQYGPIQGRAQQARAHAKRLRALLQEDPTAERALFDAPGPDPDEPRAGSHRVADSS